MCEFGGANNSTHNAQNKTKSYVIKRKTHPSTIGIPNSSLALKTSLTK